MLLKTFNQFADYHFGKPDGPWRIEKAEEISVLVQKKMTKMTEYKIDAGYNKAIAECLTSIFNSLSQMLDNIEEDSVKLIEDVCLKMIEQMERSRRDIMKSRNLPVFTDGKPDHKQAAADYKYLLLEYFEDPEDEEFTLADEIAMDRMLGEMEGLETGIPESIKEKIREKYKKSKEESLQEYREKFNPKRHIKKAKRQEKKAAALSNEIEELKVETQNLIAQERKYQANRSRVSKFIYG